MSEAMGKVGPKSSVGDLLKKHTDWWSRKGMLYAAVPHEPLGDLWLPLADGSVATDDVDVTPEILDLERLAGPVLESGSIEIIGDAIRTRAPYVRVPWVEDLFRRAEIASKRMIAASAPRTSASPSPHAAQRFTRGWVSSSSAP